MDGLNLNSAMNHLLPPRRGDRLSAIISNDNLLCIVKNNLVF